MTGAPSAAVTNRGVQDTLPAERHPDPTGIRFGLEMVLRVALMFLVH